MPRTLRVVLVTAMTLGLLVGAGPRSLACSCAGGDPRTRLGESSAAIVGTVERIGQARADGNSPFRFTVEKSVKGKFGPTMDVIGMAGNGASCGIEIQVGQRTGLFLERARGEWTAHLCSQVDAGMLLAAANPLPRPNGAGPPAFVATVEWGNVRAITLDSSGRTLVYGQGGPVLHRVEICPGGRLAVGWGGGRVVVREIATMRQVSQWPAAATLPDGGTDFSEIACRDDAAREIVLFGTSGYPTSHGEIAVARDGKIVRRLKGAWKDASFRGDSAFLSGGSFGHTLEAVDLGTARVTPVTTIAKVGEPEEVGRPVLSPDGRYLAVAVRVPSGWKGPTPSRVVLVELEKSKTYSAPLPEGNEGQIAWIARDRFLLADSVTSIVFNTKLARLGTFRGWSASRPVVAGSVGYGMAYGALHAVALPGGPVHEMRRFDTTQTHAIAGLPGVNPPSDLGPVVTPPPEEQPEPPRAAAPHQAASPLRKVIPIVVFLLLIIGTPVAVMLSRRR